jgi:DNA-binding transcriptional LysR family regulator
MMDLELTESLLAVAEHGAITDAAQTLAISQSALSRRIQQLEEALGVQLLTRSQRGVSLTAVGKVVAEEGRVLTERMRHLRKRVAAHLSLEEGLVRVGGGATAVSFLMPPVIAGFRRAHPGVQFQLKEASSRDIEQQVLEDRLELGVVTSPVRAPDLVSAVVCQDVIALVAARDHPLAKLRRVTPAALQGHRLVGFEAGSAIRQLIDGALRSVGVELEVAMELRSISAILQLVAATRDLALVSELGLRAMPRSVRRLPLRGLRIVRTLAVISRRGQALSPAAATFRAALLHPNAVRM